MMSGPDVDGHFFRDGPSRSSIDEEERLGLSCLGEGGLIGASDVSHGLDRVGFVKVSGVDASIGGEERGRYSPLRSE